MQPDKLPPTPRPTTPSTPECVRDRGQAPLVWICHKHNVVGGVTAFPASWLGQDRTCTRVLSTRTVHVPGTNQTLALHTLCCARPRGFRMVSMKGMPLAPSQRGAAGRAPSQHLKGGNFGKALVNIAPPPSAAPVAQLAPLQISAHKALKSSSTSSPARHPFSETWPRRSGETLAQQVIGAARQWRERARKAPAGLKPELATGEGSSSSTVGEDAPPRLFIVVKPFGKGGIRLAWQRSSSEQDEALFVEFEGDARIWKEK